MFDIPAAIEAGSKLVNGVVNRIWPDPTEAEKAKLEMLRVQIGHELAITQAQTKINEQEARHPSVFVSGWRPFVGWVCAVALLYTALIEPLLRFVALVVFGYQGIFPVIDTWLTMQVLAGLLGLGAMRTHEKKNGVARVK